jgi:hypothetical protein
MLSGERQSSELRLRRAGLVIVGKAEPLEDHQFSVPEAKHVHGAVQASLDPVMVCGERTQLSTEGDGLIGGGKSRVCRSYAPLFRCRLPGPSGATSRNVIAGRAHVHREKVGLE